MDQQIKKQTHSFESQIDIIFLLLLKAINERVPQTKLLKEMKWLTCF